MSEKLDLDAKIAICVFIAFVILGSLFIYETDSLHKKVSKDIEIYEHKCHDLGGFIVSYGRGGDVCESSDRKLLMGERR